MQKKTIGVKKFYKDRASTSCFRNHTKVFRCLILLAFGTVMFSGLYHHHNNEIFRTDHLVESNEIPVVGGFNHGNNDFRNPVEYNRYKPSQTEDYIIKNLDKLGYGSVHDPITCKIWETSDATTKEIHDHLVQYEKDIELYSESIKKFEPIPQLMPAIKKSRGKNQQEICKTTRLHPDGLASIFHSNQLSFTRSGYVEPLLPPLRHPKICKGQKMMSLDYLVHDFEAMCNKLKPTSKLVFVDMGASLEFHGQQRSPVMELLDLYEKMGFTFDHIYGFEVTPTDPEQVFVSKLPAKYMAPYHWINVGVSTEKTSQLNPLYSIINTFDEDDLIVVKLDIDTPSIELPLVLQLLDDNELAKLVDQFYFEHHVHMGELASAWRDGSMNGTVKDSMGLFSKMREKGILAHSWV